MVTRANTWQDAYATGTAKLDLGDGIVIPLPIDGTFPGEPGPPGAGVPVGGAALQVVRKNAAGTTTEWVSPSKSMVGLGNTDNTSDTDKPISAATQESLSSKADLVGGVLPLEQVPGSIQATDANVATLINAASTGSAIDARINTQVTPVVEQITADYIAGDQAVVDAAAAAVNANPKITGIDAALIAAGMVQDFVTNGSFRDGLSGWGNLGGWTPGSGAATTWARTTSGSDGSLTQSIVIPAHLLGKTLRLFARAMTTSAGSLFMRVTTTAGNTDSSQALATGSYVLKTMDVTIPANQGTTPIVLNIGRASGTVYMTAIRLEAL